MSRPAKASILVVLALATVVPLAAVAAAPVHDGLVDMGWMSPPGSDRDADKDFLKVFRRLVLLPLGLVFLVICRPWRGGLLRPYGLLRPEARLRPAAIAFPLTVGLIVAILAGHYVSGWMQFEDPPRWAKFGERLIERGLGGLTIGFVEEWLFRGWLLRQFVMDISLRAAVILSAVLYAFVHAFKPGNLTQDVSHDAGGALEAVGGWLSYALDPTAFGPPFVGLFLFGLLLTALYLRTRTLWAPIAVHAAAVWVLFSHGALTQHVPERTWAGSKWLYDGPPAWAVLVVAIVWLWPRGIRELPSARWDSGAPPSGGEG